MDWELKPSIHTKKYFAKNRLQEDVHMKYSKYIELDNVTIGDCIAVFENEGLEAIINDGKLVNFESEQKNNT